MKGKIEAVLFDLDGTILDSGDFIFGGFKHSLYKNAKKRIKWEDIEHVLGKPLAECYSILFPEGDVEILCKTHRDFQAKNAHLVKPIASSKAVLEKLVDSGIKSGVITNRHADTLKDSLERVKFESLFDVLISVDDVTNPKPHPESLIKALKRLKVFPSRALMVGDTEVDVLAGKNAGVKTVGVTYGFHGARVADAKPDFLIDDISQLIGIVFDNGRV